MSEENKLELKITQEFIRFSQLLDPNLETTSISENRNAVKIYFKKAKNLCYSYEYEIDKNKKISIYRNILIEGEQDPVFNVSLNQRSLA